MLSSRSRSGSSIPSEVHDLDLQSFLRNDEVNVVVLGPDFAAQMEAMFQRDLQEARPVLL